MNNNKGQVLLEYVLLMLIFLGLFVVLTDVLRSFEFLDSVTQEPWRRLDYMVQNGAWTTDGSGPEHPNYIRNHYSLKGDAL